MGYITDTGAGSTGSVKEGFQSSFELTCYITNHISSIAVQAGGFQSSFELTGYITLVVMPFNADFDGFQSSFELTGYIT